MKSILRRPDYTHPFEPFSSNDLPGCMKLIAEGFDPFWTDDSGMTCAMEAASRGHGAALNLALRESGDARALALAKNDIGLDAFDMAAACGSTACMALLTKHLPAGHASSIGHSFLWHACEVFKSEPELAYSWLVDLTATGQSMADLTEAASAAHALKWIRGTERLAAALNRSAAQGSSEIRPAI